MLAYRQCGENLSLLATSALRSRHYTAANPVGSQRFAPINPET